MKLRGLSTPLALVISILLAACNGASQAAMPATSPATSPTIPPTALPTATPLPAFAAADRIAGLDVGGMNLDQARALLEAKLLPLAKRPLEIQVDGTTLDLSAADIGLELPIDDLLHEAERQLIMGKGVRVPLRLGYNRQAVRTQVEKLAKQIAQNQAEQPALVVTSTETLSRSFLYRPTYQLDVAATLSQIDARLQSLQGSPQITLTLEEQPLDKTRDLALLREQITAMAEEWNGVVGYYLYDIESGQEVGLHEHSIFSGASVMKIPIMLQSFISLPRFNEDEEFWLEKMIVESDNKAANALLAHIGGGGGTEDALVGVEEVNKTLRSLELPFTYQSLPYESGDYLINRLGKKIYRGPTLDGPEPQTEADPYVRTTPLEMGRLLTMIVECSQGKGALLERYKTELSAKRCGEMIERLKRNGDKIRMVAGLPEGTSVAHKSGWVEDMQADVGLVTSPGGDFVVAIYLYRQIKPGKTYLADEIAAPVIANFARLTYSFYNPEPLNE